MQHALADLMTDRRFLCCAVAHTLHRPTVNPGIERGEGVVPTEGRRMRKWWPLVAVSLGTLMLLVDVTIVNVALPNMAVDLRTSFSSLQWVVDIYALALAALLLSAGTISDR